MRRLLPLALVLLSGCGSATTAPTLPVQATTAGQATGTSTTPGPGLPTAAAGAVIPAACAAGFTDYLKLIEPIVAGFDPARSTFGDFYTVDNAASDKGTDVMLANGAKATYSCPEVGLEYNSFGINSPWAAILEIAHAQASGTVAYLEMERKVVALDNAKLSDYGSTGCDDAVARIRQAVADQSGAGKDTVADMGVDAGLALFGLYTAYLSQVQDGVCPPDVLGNDEFDFMQEQ